MSTKAISPRQEELLKLIIEDYIATGEPVGSERFLTHHSLGLSSATIRNEMAALEKAYFLEKAHTSSGRIPSIKGYEHFAKHLATVHSKDLTMRLHDIFAHRRASIDFTLDEAAKAISDLAGLTLSISSNDASELMKSIQLTKISDSMATIVIVTSTGRVESKLLEFGHLIAMDDIRVAVRLFKERLVDTKLKDLSIKVEALAPILAEHVKNYEAIIQAFVGKVFDFHRKIQNRVYGNSNIIKANDIRREDLAKLIELIETKSVWESIENSLDEDETMKIEIRPDNIALLSKRVGTGQDSHEISIVGSHRMDYAEAKQAIALLDKFLKGR